MSRQDVHRGRPSKCGDGDHGFDVLWRRELQSLLHFGRIDGVSPSAVARRSRAKAGALRGLRIRGRFIAFQANRALISFQMRRPHRTSAARGTRQGFPSIPGVFEKLALHLHSMRRDRLLSWPARSTASSPASLLNPVGPLPRPIESSKAAVCNVRSTSMGAGPKARTTVPQGPASETLYGAIMKTMQRRPLTLRIGGRWNG